jgi:hypothetical protein
MFSAAVILPLKAFTAVVGNPLKDHLRCLSNTAKRQGGNSRKKDPLPTKAHKNSPRGAELGLSHPIAQEDASGPLKQSQTASTAIVHDPWRDDMLDVAVISGHHGSRLLD